MKARVDVGMSGITVTEDRQKNCDFTDPYFLASQAIVVTADSPITCKADLEGKKISVQTGTTAEEYCMDNGYEVLSFTANNDAAAALTTGKVDAWVVDNEVAVALAAQQGLTVLDECHHMYHGEKVAFGTITQLVLEDIPADELEDIINWCIELGLPVTLKELGIKIDE